MSFGSPVLNYEDYPLDLNSYFVSHPAATFFVRMQGSAMSHIGINDNDVLVVDRALEVKNNDIVVVEYQSEFLVRKYLKKGNKIYLVADNISCLPIEIDRAEELKLFGVVSASFRKY